MGARAIEWDEIYVMSKAGTVEKLGKTVLLSVKITTNLLSNPESLFRCLSASQSVAAGSCILRLQFATLSRIGEVRGKLSSVVGNYLKYDLNFGPLAQVGCRRQPLTTAPL
jgi:hypothetical protein